MVSRRDAHLAAALAVLLVTAPLYVFPYDGAHVSAADVGWDEDAATRTVFLNGRFYRVERERVRTPLSSEAARWIAKLALVGAGLALIWGVRPGRSVGIERLNG
jgi:hypothetical protein